MTRKFLHQPELSMSLYSEFSKTVTLFVVFAMVPFFACRQPQKMDVSIVEKRNTVDDSVKKLFKFNSTEFDRFYNKFINDSLFQLSRVSFPIDGGLADYEGEKKWYIESWPMIKWDLRHEMNNSSDSFFVDQTDSSVFWGSYCRDCGFSAEVKFQKKSGEWFLVYRQENNF